MTDEFKERIRSRMDGTTAPEAATESLRACGRHCRRRRDSKRVEQSIHPRV